MGAGTTLTLSKVVRIITDGIETLLGLAMTISIAMIVYGGFKMATARADAKKFTEGKDILTNAAIGLTVILATGIIIRTIGRFAVNPESILY